MHLIQILLPLNGDKGKSSEHFQRMREELTTRFGGITFYRNAPAEGLWEDDGAVKEDTVVVAEVMADDLDSAWWASYRTELERRFEQKEIVIRSLPATRL